MKLESKLLNIWDEPFMQSELLDIKAKMLYMYLLTNALSNILGVYKISDRRILFDLCDDKLALNHLFNQLKKMKKVYRCGEWVIIKDAPLYIKKMTKTVIKEMDGLLYLLPDKIKAKMKSIHYNYAHLYNEPLLEELQKLGKSNRKTKKLEALLPLELNIDDDINREGKNERNIEKTEVSIQNVEAPILNVEDSQKHEKDGKDNATSASIFEEEKVRSNLGVTKDDPFILEGDYWVPQENSIEVVSPPLATGDEALNNMHFLDDEEISKKIKASNNFFSDFAKNARDFADKERRIEIMENNPNFQRANTIKSTKATSATECITPRDTQLKEPCVKEPSSASSTVYKNDLIPIQKDETHINKSGELPLSFGQGYKAEPSNTNCFNDKANMRKRPTQKEIELFQYNYAKTVFKQFQNAGLYQGIDYSYFYKADFQKGLNTLKMRAITVEDPKEAFALNEVIDAYLEKAKNEKDEHKRCIMAFYKMCEEREYNLLNIVNY